MLYISSRSKTDSFTAHRTLCDDRAPDGGLYLPFQIPRLSQSELQQIGGESFCENVAYILNLFFSAKLSAWDVECCIGRKPVRIVAMSHRLLTAECFHNPKSTYEYMEKSLFNRLCQLPARSNPTQWAKIVIRIAVLFGLFAAMPVECADMFDVAVTTGDFSDPLAAWYAQKMGLPIRMIVCCCNENSAAWDLIQRGDFNTNMPLVDTGRKTLDQSCPTMIEALIYHLFGQEEASRYRFVCDKRGVYTIDEDMLARLNNGLTAAVVGRERIGATIRSVYRTNQYFISPAAAIAYGGLQDYRSRTGESRNTIILSDESPIMYSGEISAACGITQQELRKLLTN